MVLLLFLACRPHGNKRIDPHIQCSFCSFLAGELGRRRVIRMFFGLSARVPFIALLLDGPYGEAKNTTFRISDEPLAVRAAVGIDERQGKHGVVAHELRFDVHRDRFHEQRLREPEHLLLKTAARGRGHGDLAHRMLAAFAKQKKKEAKFTRSRTYAGRVSGDNDRLYNFSELLGRVHNHVEEGQGLSGAEAQRVVGDVAVSLLGAHRDEVVQVVRHLKQRA